MVYLSIDIEVFPKTIHLFPIPIISLLFFWISSEFKQKLGYDKIVKDLFLSFILLLYGIPHWIWDTFFLIKISLCVATSDISAKLT